MALLYFQVPDTDPGTDGLHCATLTLHGDQVEVDLARLCALLKLAQPSPTSAGYAHVHAALGAWQRNHGLLSDGVVGPLLWRLLERASKGDSQRAAWLERLPAEHLCALFPFTTRKNVQIYAPYVLAALDAAGCGPDSALGAALCPLALATIRAEAEGFAPISEGVSRFNTALGGAPFALYEPDSEPGRRLGNTERGDGERYKGRGFVQLAGRAAYTSWGASLGLPLARLTYLANAPEVAAVLLVRILQDRQSSLIDALARGDDRAARVGVNGASHGLDRFSDTLKLWRSRIAPTLGRTGARRASAALTVDQRMGSEGFVLPVKNDPVDLRDLPYRPPLRSLPAVWPAEADIVHFFPLVDKLKLVLNQGQEGACTGFGLASVVNFLRFAACDSDAQRQRLVGVSPRMIYELARRYDEYEGSDYEGSSCRGALKGWYKHGVCYEPDWDYHKDIVPSNPHWATRALHNTLGVYYRIDKGNLVDMQAAIAEVGAIYVSAHVHAGWNLPPHRARKAGAAPGHDELAQIAYHRGGQPRQGAHAFALVGYNSRGFIVQNSWGPTWGFKGFAVLRYDDWLDNAMDAWIAALGVPGIVNNAAVANGKPAAPLTPASAPARAATDLAGLREPPQALDARHSLILDRGLVARASTRDLLQPMGLGELVADWPHQWFDAWRAQHPDEPARLVIYAHGGLNTQEDGLKRARTMAPAFLANGCYPLFIVWKTGLMETLSALADQALAPSDRAGNFLSDNVSDPLLEKLLHAPGRAVWDQIKRSALVANSADGGLTQLANSLQDLRACVSDLEVHLMGHSAGSIVLGPLVAALQKRRVPLASAHLYAPACTVDFANQNWLPFLGPRDAQKNSFPLYVSLLSDTLERRDNVALGGVLGYQKSLLYLVARSFEDNTPTPLFGMQGAWDRTRLFGEWDNAAQTLQALRDFDRAVAELTPSGALCLDPPLSYTMTATRTDANGQALETGAQPDAPDTRLRTSHGSFDGDALVVLRSLERIRGGPALQRALDLSEVP